MKNLGVSIRRATKDDLPVLLGFEQGVIAAERPFDPTLKDEQINYYDLKFFLESSDVELLVAESGDELVGAGYARIMPSKPYQKFERHAYLGFMYVKEAYRKQGLNGLILDGLKKWAVKKGMTELRLQVFNENTPAKRAYEKAGFAPHLLEMRLELEGSTI